MAGSLDTALKNAAKTVVANLGEALDTTITYTRKEERPYETNTGAITYTEVTYSSLKVPIEYFKATSEDDDEVVRAKLYITPDQIGSNQPTVQDEVTLTYAGTTRTVSINSIDTYRGGQPYLYVLMVSL